MPVLTAHLLFSVTLAGFVVAHAQEAIRVDPAQDSPLSSFRQALNSAWKRSLQASEARGRNLRAHADQQVSERWLAGPVALRLGEREVLANGSASSRETDFGLALPLWRLGQRDAAGQAAQSQSVWTQAFEQAERLRLAGLLRDAIAAVHLADVDLQQALQQAEAFGMLARDVQRRVKAGDLAPADDLAARSESLAAQAQVSAAREELALQQSNWRLLTGMDPLRLHLSEAPVMSPLPDSHPELLLAHAAVDLGQRRAAVARIQQTDAPELNLGLRQDRIGQGTAIQNSLALAVRIPIGGEVYKQPRIAAALGELDAAQTQAERVRERLLAQLAQRQSQLMQSQSLLLIARERASLLRDRARLIDKSFRAGETALPEMLRALAAAASAETAYARQQINHQWAISRLEQAMGLLP